MSMARLPLIRNPDPGAWIAFRLGQPITQARFLQDVARVASLLPDRPHMLNLCGDRYHFAVGFGAALLRRQLSLLPPNQTPDFIHQLSRRYAGVYCLSDVPGSQDVLESVVFPPLTGATAAPPAAAFPAEQTAAILFTSGSTGEPVPNAKSWGSLVTGGLAEADRLGVAAHPGMVIVGTVPPQHMYGLESTVLLALQGGLALHAARPFYPADIRAELAALPRPRGLVTTPVHLRALLAESDPLPRVDFLLCATAPLAPQLAAAAETRFGAQLHEIYGCTEAGQVASRRTVAGAHWRALREVALHQDANGTWVSGGHVEKPVLLGDVIELRDPNTFLLHGRTADLVNIAGKRSSIANLNYHLNSIEGVQDGVFVMPDDQGDNVTRLLAFAVAPGLTVEAVMDALRQRIDMVFLPRPLCLVDALPRNTTGKLPREAVGRLVAHATAKTPG